jgi:hypothetical protein
VINCTPRRPTAGTAEWAWRPQIISKEVYEKVDQQKFVALIAETDETGEPYIPTFLRSRIYINMSDPGRYSEGFEQLLRWIFNQPVHKKPTLGTPPTYLFNSDETSLGTAASLRLGLSAISLEKPSAPRAISSYFDTLTTNIEALRLIPEDNKEYDDQVVKSIEAFTPYRNEAVDAFLAIAEHLPTSEGYAAIHRFFENLLPYCFGPQGRDSWNNTHADNFKFITRDTGAILVCRCRINGLWSF